MSKALIATPVYADELGLVMLRAGRQALTELRATLGSGPALLSRIPDELAGQRAGLTSTAPTIRSRLAGSPLAMFFQQARVFDELGGSAMIRAAQDGSVCALASGSCAGGMTWSGGMLPMPLCWHHDNAHREVPIINLAGIASKVLMRAGLARIAAFVEREPGEVSPAELAWWAAAHGVHDCLPEALARQALGRKEQATSRNTPHGWRDTDARYSPLDHVADVREMVKPIRFEVDAEPASVFMLRPKLTRWQSEAYLKFVRSQPCVATGAREGVEAHHLIGHGHSGMATKTHDLFTFPLAHDQHMKLHNQGWQQWEREHGSQLEHALATINKAAGLGVFG